MRSSIRKLWPVIKWLLTIAILAAIGRRFYLDLRDYPDLRSLTLGPGWIILMGALYIAALGCFMHYWSRLLTRMGQPIPMMGALKAYFLGLLGKYLPGKVGALVMRAEIAGGYGVQRGIAYTTSFYEVLTTMAASVLLAAVLFAWLGPASATVDWVALENIVRLRPMAENAIGWQLLVLSSLVLLGLVGVPILPPVFNRLSQRLATPFRGGADSVPRFTGPALLEGLFHGFAGWVLMGLSFACALAAFGLPVSWNIWFISRMTACIGLGYVAGFAIFWIPSALGVREYFLTVLLIPELVHEFGLGEDYAAGQAKLIVVVLRLGWTAAEVVTAAAVYALPMRSSPEGATQPIREKKEGAGSVSDRSSPT